MIEQGTNKKGKKKQRQKDKTAARNIDPYFGDLTKIKPSCNSTKTNCNYQATANSLSEMFPNIDKNIISNLLNAHKGNFENTLNSLIEMNTTKIEDASSNNNSPEAHSEPNIIDEKEDKKELELKLECEQIESKLEEAKVDTNNTDSKVDKLNEFEEEYTEEYKKDINELALNSVADELISKYPK